MLILTFEIWQLNRSSICRLPETLNVAARQHAPLRPAWSLCLRRAPRRRGVENL